MSNPIDDEGLVTPMPAALPLATVDPTTIAEESAAAPADLPKVNARYIWFMVLAQFGVFMAFITPLAISLSIKVNALAPGHEEYLGFITGAGALFVMLTAPFMGVWSDRTRTRIGRRRPFMIGGMVVGVVSLVVMATCPFGAGPRIRLGARPVGLGHCAQQSSDLDCRPPSRVAARQGRRPHRVRHPGRSRVRSHPDRRGSPATRCCCS